MALIFDGRRIEIQESEETSNFQIAERYDMQDARVTGETNVQESTELGDSLKELNNDAIEPGTRMSGIDLRSRLHYMEVGSLLAVDSLVYFKVLPIECLGFTRQKKRISVSLAGAGRDDIVKITSGQREHNENVAGGGRSMFDKIKGVFGGGKKEG